MSVTRRMFLVTVPVAALAFLRSPQSPGGWEGSIVPAAASGGLEPGSAMSAGPVVSFHLDQPYLDLTGLEKPYVPPAGLRSGAPLVVLSEEEVFSRYYGFI